jgi:predicted nuclease of predicted toxin-antitoxin system
MKFKLDENFGNRTQNLFLDAGYDIETVLSEKLGGCEDNKIYEVCCKEQRCLVTFDLDFSSPIRFPPELCGGIIIIRLPRNPSLEMLECLVRQTLTALNKIPFNSDLWIVELGRIRIHQKEKQ